MLPTVSAEGIRGKITNVTKCFCSRYTCKDHECYLLFLLRVCLERQRMLPTVSAEGILAKITNVTNCFC